MQSEEWHSIEGFRRGRTFFPERKFHAKCTIKSNYCIHSYNTQTHTDTRTHQKHSNRIDTHRKLCSNCTRAEVLADRRYQVNKEFMRQQHIIQKTKIFIHFPCVKKMRKTIQKIIGENLLYTFVRRHTTRKNTFHTRLSHCERNKNNCRFLGTFKRTQKVTIKAQSY